MAPRVSTLDAKQFGEKGVSVQKPTNQVTDCGKQRAARSLPLSESSRFPDLDKFVCTHIGNHQTMPYTVKVREYQNRKGVAYDVTGSRFCHNKGSQHKSNRVYYIADLMRGEVIQKCFKCTKYVSPGTPIPPNLYLTVDDEDDATEVLRDSWQPSL